MKIFNFKLIFAICIIFSFINTKAEVLNELNPKKEVFLDISALSFLKNDEYFNKFTQGTTALGFQLEPKIGLKWNDKNKVEVGVFLCKFYGKDDFYKAIPTFAFKHKFNPNSELILGRLYGSKEHKMEEQIFSTDHYIYNNLENGIQYKLNNKSFCTDIWVNWEKFILKNDSNQEEFTFGTSSKYRGDTTKSVSISIPFQTIITHKGGQIDSSPLAVQTLFNAMSGITLNYRFSEYKHFRLNFLGFYYDALSAPNYPEPNSVHYHSGLAILPKIEYYYKDLQLIASYWHNEGFIAPRGEYLYQSVSNYNQTFKKPFRDILSAKLFYNGKFAESVDYRLTAEYFLDMYTEEADYSFGFYISINENFRLW